MKLLTTDVIAIIIALLGLMYVTFVGLFQIRKLEIENKKLKQKVADLAPPFQVVAKNPGGLSTALSTDLRVIKNTPELSPKVACRLSLSVLSDRITE